jgi:uncharacterized protein (TIGR02231 family)
VKEKSLTLDLNFEIKNIKIYTMEKLLVAFWAILFTINGITQEEKKIYVDSKAESAIIYLNGAEIEQNAKVILQKGNNLVVFRGLSPSLNTKSIRVSSDIELSVLSISSKTNFLLKKNELPLIKKLNDSLAIAEDALKASTDELNAFSIEKEMIVSNKSIGGTNGVLLNELKQGADFFRQRILEINKNISRVEKKIKDHETLVAKYKQELTELNAKSSYSESEIQILFSSETAGNATIKLQYLVYNAGWVPGYEIKADDLNQPIELVYKAKVFNNTSIDWENINIKLSIADPNIGINKPELSPWFIDFYSANQKGNLGYAQNLIQDNRRLFKEYDLEEDQNIELKGEYDEMEIPEMNTEFEIKSKYSIPANDKPYLIDIENHKLSASFKHFAVTKLDKGVFLLGRITGWQDLNLIDGYANIYFRGTYLGESLIKTRNVKDTLDLSLGRDDKVLVTRSKLKEYSSKQLIGTKTRETLSFELIAKNNRKNAIEIEIQDQIPISKNSEIEVKELELSGGEFNPVTGEVKWKHKIQPGESKKMVLTFYIRYPKNQTVEVENMKQRAIRKF